MYVIPKKDCIVRDPLTRIPIPVKGQRVPDNTFWRRRIKAGDVFSSVEVAPEKPTINKKSSKDK